MSIILASNSPRRKQLLTLGWDYHSVPAEVNERPRPGENAPDYVLAYEHYFPGKLKL